ncbi:hypothetical protein ACHAXT_006507 [Thalassiosira profunda]
MAASSGAAFAKLPNPDEPNHAVYGSLLRPGLLERFEANGNTYFARDVQGNCKDTDCGQTDSEPIQVVYFHCRVGPRLTGHDGVVHGGVITLLFDEACGWAYEGITYGWAPFPHHLSIYVSNDRPGVTANLSVNFKRPLKTGVECVMRVYLERLEGRKLFFRSTLESAAGEEVFADATCVYVRLRSRL